MKSASAATLAILASGQYVRFNFYKFTLASGANLYFTDADYPLTVAGQAYDTSLVIRRGGLKQKIGLDAEHLDLEIAPQFDAPNGVATAGGLPFLQACRTGVFDGAKVLFSKGFFNPPTVAAPAIDTSPGIVDFHFGRVNEVRPGRQLARFTVESFLAGLNVAMPRNILQVGCVHTLFDAGCALVKASFTTTQSITATGPNSVLAFTTGLTQANGYFDLGVITFTSGANAGVSRTVKSYLNANGAVTLINPLPNAPATSDAFTIVPGCDKQQATCSAKFSNLAHFRGYPYIPVPETLYDGGTANGPAPTLGGQGGLGGGSLLSGILPVKLS